MQVNKEIDYSLILIRALKDTYKSGEFVSLETAAEDYNLPYSFLEKLAGKLKRAGILNSQKGKSGGYRLALKPSTISVGKIMDVFQEKPASKCGTCYLADTCPSISGIQKIDTAVRKTLNRLTVNNL